MPSAKLRLFQVVLVIFINASTAGIIFGFPALKTVLIRKGTYSELCTDHGLSPFPTCEQQELRLNNIFVNSVAISSVASLPAGAILDRVGPTRTSIFGSILFGLGYLLFGSGNITWPIAFDGYSIGSILTSVGLILSCIMAAFNASSTIYVFYDWVDRKTGGVSIKTWFWCYTMIPALFITLQGIAGPRKAYLQQTPPQANEATAIGTSPVAYGSTSTSGLPTTTTPRSQIPLVALRKDDFIGVVSKRSLVGQILSRHFWVLLLFFSVYADRVNWLIQTISEQLVFYLDDPTLANRAVTLFTILLPLGGIVGVPMFGWLLDTRTVFDASLVLMVGGAAYGALGMMHSTVAQIMSISIFVIIRPLLYVFVGDYCGKAFGFQTFGRIYGLTNTLVGLLGLVLGPIDRLAKGSLRGNYDIVNGAGLVMGLISTALITWSIRASSKAKQRAT